MRRIVLLIGLFFILGGCAGILNPYDSDFSCPATYEGRCVSIQEAYETSLDPNFTEPVPNDYLYEYNQKMEIKKSSKTEKPSESTGVLRLEDKPEVAASVGSDTSYTEALYNEIKGLLKEPNTPIVRPPKIMRILVLAYPDGNNKLYMPRYVYTIVDDPRWVVVDPYMLNNMEDN